MNKSLSLRYLVTLVAFALLAGIFSTVLAETVSNSNAQINTSFVQASQFEKSGDFVRARRLYRQSYRQAVSDKQDRLAARAAFKLARISQRIAANKQGAEKATELKNAERSYHLALKHQPEARAIYNNLAELYRSQGKTKEAEEYYKKALAEKVEIKVHEPATERLEIIPATYKTITKSVLIQEASERMVLVPAEYESRSERVLVKAASARWEKGACADGKVDRIDSDGTKNCKIEVPAEYKTVQKRVLVAPASERRISIPAEYSTVTESVKVADEQTRTIKVPARNITKTQELKNDGREDLYKANLAKLRAEQGNWRDAEILYRELVISEPQSSKYHRLMLNQYQESGKNPATYLWLLVNNGQILRAQDGALAALESGKGTAEEREEWLMIFAAALAKTHLDPAGFTRSERGQRLGKLTQDATLADATTQLLTLLAGGSWDRNSYPYWQAGSPFDEAPQGIWPRDAFRLVTRSMSKWYAANDKIEPAKNCLTMTITFAADEVDPVAISDLADIYIGLGDIGAVHRLLSDYEVRMFQGKSGAYRKSMMEKILEYHSVLGKIYAHAGDNGDPGSITSALFQLKHAKRVADVLERKSEEKTNEPLFTAELAQLLAREYQEQNNTDAAIRIRLDTASRYAKAGNNATASRLLVAEEGVNWADYVDQYPGLRPVIEERSP